MCDPTIEALMPESLIWEYVGQGDNISTIADRLRVGLDEIINRFYQLGIPFDNDDFIAKDEFFV